MRPPARRRAGRSIVEVHVGGERRAGGRCSRHSRRAARRRRAASNSTTNSIRRMNAASMFCAGWWRARHARRSARAAAAGRPSRGWRSGRGRRETSVRLPNSASASSKNSTARVRSAASNTSARFFSVSPIHFDTTRERSTTQQVAPERVRDHLGGERLAGAGRPGEQHPHARAPASGCASVTSVRRRDLLHPAAFDRLLEHLRALRREHQVGPSDAGVAQGGAPRGPCRRYDGRAPAGAARRPGPPAAPPQSRPRP